MENNNKPAGASRLKILQALEGFYPYIDGVVKVMDNYAGELSKTAECKILASNIKPKEFDYSRLPYEVIKCGGFMPSGYKGMRLPAPALNFRLKRKIKKEKFDIFHIHSPFLFARYLQKIARRQKTPVVITFHTKYKEDIERTLKIRFLRKILMRYIIKSFNRADAVWAVNSASADVLRGYGFKGEIGLMPNGTDMKYPEGALAKRAEIREKHKVSENEAVLLFVGRLFLYKNLYFICDSLKILKEKGLKFKMIFVGEGDDTKKLQSYITESNLSQDVILTGLIADKEEIIKYYLASDLFLFPSTFDSAPIAMIEAAACRLPAVLIDGSAAAEGKIHGVNASLSQEIPQAYAEKILELCEDPEKRLSMGENASRDLVLSWEQITGGVLAEYYNIIEKYKAKQTKNT